MKLAWLEDFLTLTEAGTFSRAAQLRNITQPAFSRRIRMLEAWLGVTLVNRRRHRMTLTPTAARHEPRIRSLVAMAYELRSHMQADSRSRTRISLTTQHTLMVSHLPRLLRFLREQQQETTFNVRTGNLDDCITQLTRGEADLLLRFEAESEPPAHDLAGTERLALGRERLLPVTARGRDGQPVFDPGEGGSVSLLNYPEDSFLGRVIRRECLPRLVRRYSVESACESAFTVGIKEMALAGMGIAWLPRGLVERELGSGSLVSLHDKLGSPALTIAIYCRPDDSNPALNQLWETLAHERPRL